MKKLKIDFFHDVLWAWCYALSPRLRHLRKELIEDGIELDVYHHSFALAKEKVDLSKMFGDKERAKKEILNHWKAANDNSDEKLINYELMKTRTHDYPYSMPGLIACEAAAIMGGEEAHWDYFDRIQKAHLTECLDITKEEVQIMCAKDIGLDESNFKKLLYDDKTKELVEKDLELANAWGITGVPSLVIDERYLISGALKKESLKKQLMKIANEEIL